MAHRQASATCHSDGHVPHPSDATTDTGAASDAEGVATSTSTTASTASTATTVWASTHDPSGCGASGPKHTRKDKTVERTATNRNLRQ